MNTSNLYDEIYSKVFCKTFNQSCYVFLCGGAGKIHIRNKVRHYLENKNFKIFYPEDLFMDMLNRDKKSDLLEYENFLAQNADVVCVICESIGSAVELGAFAQNEEIKKKMIVAVMQKFSRDKSFVMMGPVKHLKKTNKNSLILYREDEPEALSDELSKVFRNLYKKSVADKTQSFNMLSTYISFIPVIVYFYQKVSRREMHINIKLLSKNMDNQPVHYNELFNASIKYLIKVGTLITEYNSKGDEVLSLSTKGYNETFRFIKLSSVFNYTMLHDRIRCAILKKQLKY